MAKFIKDIFMEDKKDNKYSSKKTMGIVGGLLAFMAFVVDGFHFYDINNEMFNSMLVFSATMLGLSVGPKIFQALKTKEDGIRSDKV